VTVLPAQNLFVSDYNNGNILEYTPGGVRTTFASGLSEPLGLAFNSAGVLFEADSGSYNIYEFTPGGVQSNFTDQVVAVGLAFNSAGKLFEADVEAGYNAGRIYEWTAGPPVIGFPFATGLSEPFGLAFNSAGVLFEADSGSGNIYEFMTNGTKSTFASGLSDPLGLAFNSAGVLFEADLGSGNIYEFTPGGVQSTFASGLSPVALAFNSAGVLFEGDTNLNIYEFTPGGVRTTFASGVLAKGLAFQPAAVSAPSPAFSGLAASQSITYGSTAITLAGKLSATGPAYPAGGETITVTINGNAQTTTINDSTGDFSFRYNPGTIPASATPYTITYSYAGDASLGSANDASTTLTVNQANASVTTWPTASAITYGQTLASSILSGGSATPAGSFAFTSPSTKPGVGTSSQSVTFTPSDTTDYQTAANTVSLIVAPAPLTVTAANVSRPYGQTNPAFTGAITGVTNGDNITASYTCSATTSSSAGTYSIVPSLVDPGNRQTNYTVTLVNGILTVGQATPIITWTNPASITYGTALGSIQLDATTNVPGSLFYAPPAGTVLNAGTNTLSVGFTPSNTLDYSSVTNTVSLVVAPAPLTVTAANVSRPYGQTNPAFTGAITGVTNGDNITASYTCSATTSSSAGTYSIVPSLVDPGNRHTNYTVTLVNGILTVVDQPGVSLLGPTNGAVYTAPANIVLNVQAWQLVSDEYIQNVSFYATGTNIGSNVLVASVTNSLSGTNDFQAIWTNDVPGTCAITTIATDNLGGSTTSAWVNITVVPVILVNGQYTNTHSFTFLATNTISVTMTNPLPGGYVLYSTDGTDPLNPNTLGQLYNGAIAVTSSEFIRAGTTDASFNPLAEADPVNITVIPLYPLYASTAGGGTFTVSPPNGPYADNTVVTLTAAANGGWSTLGWTGDATTNTGTLLLTMNSTKTVQAVFGTSLSVQETAGPVQVSSSQSFYPEVNGSILVSPSQSLYPYGSSVLLTAVSSNGNYFELWLHDASSGGSNSPLSFVVSNGTPLVQAAFAHLPANQFSLTVEIGSGVGTATASPYATFYASNTTVSLTEMPSAGQIFVGWSGATNSTANPLPWTMVSNTTIIASFSTNLPPIITITNPPDGTTFTAPAAISIGVAVTNLGGVVTNVAFFANAIPIGVATNSPFTLVWSNAVAGTYTLTAVATSTTGLSGTSEPETVLVNPPSAVFAFGSATYSVHESGGAVNLTVVNYDGLSGSLNYQTISGSAFGGNGISGDYTASQGNLVFMTNQTSQSFNVPIIDNFINGPALQFQVKLLEPTIGSLGNPATATVTIIRDDPGAATNAVLAQVFPTNRPAMTGQLTVWLPPFGNGMQWRLPWEFAWRDSGSTAISLTAGDYPVEFRDVPGYLAIPLASDPLVTNGLTTVVTNTYYPTPLLGSGALGSLTVSSIPANLSGAGWQFIGETAWRASGSTAANLLPDTYLVAFEPVSGYATPTSLAVVVTNGMSVLVAGNYVLAQTLPSGVDLPQSQSTATILNYANGPYGFSGQLQTDVGFGSGAAVTANVVLTAAHMVFNDYTLSYVTNAWWSFQEQAGIFQPEPMAARGWYVLSGYAAQRTNDLTVGGYQPDQSSPQSQDMDVAALYFLTYSARTGFGGFISSDAVPNPYLTGSAFKTLVGYPVDGSMFNEAVSPGQLYATPLDHQAFVQTNDQVYTASWLFSYPGNSGGPLCVLYTNNGLYYPAAVYLGTLFNGINGSTPYASVVRAIDSNVVNLITLASDLGDTGTNNSGGGVITIIPSRGVSASHPGYLILQLGPPSAVQAGAAWDLAGQSASYYSTVNPSLQEVTTTNTLLVQFKPIPGWNLPTNRSVAVVPGVILTNVALYTVTNPLLTLDLVNGLGIAGTTNTTYQIQSNSSLTGGAWIAFRTNTLISPGFNPITNKPIPGFYRALWLTN
jgi:hypothetical protein